MEPKKQSSGTDATAVKSNTDKNISPATTATISPTTTNEPANQSATNIEAGETNKNSNGCAKNFLIAVLILAALLGGVYFLTIKSGPFSNALTGNSTDQNSTDLPTLTPNESYETEEGNEKNEKLNTTKDTDLDEATNSNKRTTKKLKIRTTTNSEKITTSPEKITTSSNKITNSDKETSPIEEQTTESNQDKLVSVEGDDEIDQKTTKNSESFERIENKDDKRTNANRIENKNSTTNRFNRFRNKFSELTNDLKNKIKEKTGSN